MVESPTRKSGRSQEAFPEVQEKSGGPPGGPAVVGRRSRRSRSDQEANPEIREWSRGPPKGPGVVERLC